MSKSKLLEFELLRTIAICLIIFYHLNGYIIYNVFWFQELVGLFGLGLFTFISGFLIHYNNSNINSIKGFIYFFKKRIIRLFPLYWLALIIYIISFSIIPFLIYPNPPNIINISFSNLFIHFIGAEGLLAPQFATPFFTLYFIGIMMFYYCIYPFINQFSKTFLGMICFSSFIFIILLVFHLKLNIIDGRLLKYYFCFVSGILASKFGLFENHNKNRDLMIVFSILVFLLLLYHSKIMNFGDIFGFNALIVLILVTSIYIIFFVSKYIILYFNEIHIRIICSIAIASYCVYLFHRPFFTFISMFNIEIVKTSIFINNFIILISLPILFIGSYYLQLLEIRVIKKNNL